MRRTSRGDASYAAALARPEFRAIFAASAIQITGTVVSANVVTEQFSGRSKGFGFVEMESSEHAQKAVAQLNGRELDGRQIKVEVAKPKTEGRRDSDRGGYGRGGWR